MNKCPNCGETAVGLTDKLFKTSKLTCQHCGTKLKLPSNTNLAVIAVVLISWLIFPLFNLDTMTQILFGVGIVVVVGIVLVLLPLQIKEGPL